MHVVLQLSVGAFVGGLVAGMPLENANQRGRRCGCSNGIIPVVFNEGLSTGANRAVCMPCSARLPYGRHAFRPAYSLPA